MQRLASFLRRGCRIFVVKGYGFTEQHPTSKEIESVFLNDSAGLSQPASRGAGVAERHVVAEAQVHRSTEGVLMVPVAAKHREGTLLEPDRTRRVT